MLWKGTSKPGAFLLALESQEDMVGEWDFSWAFEQETKNKKTSLWDSCIILASFYISSCGLLESSLRLLNTWKSASKDSTEISSSTASNKRTRNNKQASLHHYGTSLPPKKAVKGGFAAFKCPPALPAPPRPAQLLSRGLAAHTAAHRSLLAVGILLIRWSGSLLRCRTAPHRSRAPLLLVLLAPHVLMAWHDPHAGISQPGAHTSSTNAPGGLEWARRGFSCSAGHGFTSTPCLWDLAFSLAVREYKLPWILCFYLWLDMSQQGQSTVPLLLLSFGPLEKGTS